ncbi:unnamed protein product [Mytilus coruscus]|uniref:Secreted protein n=1 Tax=Mytilus coruscus TaxID=42192 RepID=A0A6J8DCY0_MYTCO|nr:unnamed protein product [Mytilus coruscus]
MPTSVGVFLLIITVTNQSYGFKNYVITQIERNLNDLKNLKFCQGNEGGFMAGKYYASGGDGSNILCLSKDPEWKRNGHFRQQPGIWKFVGCKKYAMCGLQNIREIRCPYGSGKNDLSHRWHKEFSGYLVAQASEKERTATEYICADEHLESVPGGDRNDNEAVLYPVEVRECATLKCPPYVKGRELTCAVCSQ